MKAFIYRTKRRRNGVLIKSKTWYACLRLDGDAKESRFNLHVTDERVANEKLRSLIREREQEAVGLIPSRKIRESAARSLLNHLGDFLADLRRRGRAKTYVSNIEYRVSRLITDCKWNIARDVTPDGFSTWLRSRPELSDKTANDYLEAIRLLFSWMIKMERLEKNPLAKIEKVKTKGREPRQRRAFNLEEFQRLLSVADENNKAVYLTAVHTGLRRSELAALKWSDVFLEAARPYVQARASTTKNGEMAILYLHPELVTMLRKLKTNAVPDTEFIFHVPRIERFRRDLKKAGVAYVDANGYRVDFHALRKTFGTNLAIGGVPRRVAMSLMRHSDGKLTDKIYVHEKLLGTESAIDALPTYTANDTSKDTPAAGKCTLDESQSVRETERKEINKTLVNTSENHILTASVTSSHEVQKWREWRGSNP